MFRLNVTSKFIPKINAKANANANKRDNYINKEKQVEVVKISPSILSRPSKETLEKSKFYKKKYIKLKKNGNSKDRCLYVQALTLTVNKILKLKKNFPNLSYKKIESIHNTINNSGKVKLRINITIKKLSQR